MAREDHGRVCFAFVFACVVGKTPKTPNLSPMADNAITRGGIRGLGSPLDICGQLSISKFFEKFYLLFAVDTPMERVKDNSQGCKFSGSCLISGYLVSVQAFFRFSMCKSI